ncbi:MAG: hypothetical protein ACRDYV_05230, partial [Acidimicrobiia bacterium]
RTRDNAAPAKAPPAAASFVASDAPVAAGPRTWAGEPPPEDHPAPWLAAVLTFCRQPIREVTVISADGFELTIRPT